MKQRNIFLIVLLLAFIVAACGERKAAEEEVALEQEEMAEDLPGAKEATRFITGGSFDCDKAVKLYQEVYEEYQKYLEPALKGDKNAQANLDKLDNTLSDLNEEMDKIDAVSMDMDCIARISSINIQIQALVAKSLMGAGFGK